MGGRSLGCRGLSLAWGGCWVDLPASCPPVSQVGYGGASGPTYRWAAGEGELGADGFCLEDKQVCFGVLCLHLALVPRLSCVLQEWALSSFQSGKTNCFSS